MKKPPLLILVILITFFPLSSGSAQDAPKLTARWATEGTFSIPESVFFDPSREVLYVSNINGGAAEKNGQGFISRLTLDGAIETHAWIRGLNAPKGMALYGNILSIADIDRVVQVDIPAGVVTAIHEIPGARFLNDVAVDEEGTLYVSDSSRQNSVIYRLGKGTATVWLDGAEIAQPNGLFIEKGFLIVGNSGDGRLKKVSLTDKGIRTLADTGAGIDGIAGDGRGNYFISDWRGKTSLVGADGGITELIDTTGQGIQAADITYIPSQNLLLVPTFFNNRVTAHEFTGKAGTLSP